ncbi:MAG TPA: phosphomannomutase/phosphoglucomutase [Thermomicrobiales bacterium]|nr:phosphomannomutase/phosphoglucomutase [Thermomicrobiales bacterium]
MSEPTDEARETERIAELFKAYDIRGIVPNELNAEIANLIGRGLVAVLQPEEVAVGRDMRLSGPAIAAGLIDGIRDGGADVVDLGLVSTDALYFAVGNFGYPAGVMVTASHNPAKYNGLKICGKEARPLSLDTGLATIRDAIVEHRLPPPETNGARGTLHGRDILDAYAKYMLSLIDVSRIKSLKIAIDAGNGMAGLTVPKVFAHLPVEVVPLFFELDGSFPNHEANPIEPQNVRDLQRVVVEQHCDFGAAFDGDADRVFFIDEHGKFVGGDMITALVAAKMLERNPGAAIVYNLICSRSVPETIARLGGKPIRSRVGHSYIKALMRAEDAVFGGEHSGHFYFRDLWYADSGMLALLTVLEIVSDAHQPLSAVIRPLDTRFRSGEINSEVADPTETMLRIERHYAAEGAEIDHLDGITVSFPTWWFNVRPSNTQPLLRLNLEADDRATMERKTREVLALIRDAKPGAA